MAIQPKLIALALASTACFNLAYATGHPVDPVGSATKSSTVSVDDAELIAKGVRTCADQPFGSLHGHDSHHQWPVLPSAVVPEPSTAALLLCGLALYGLCVHRNGRQNRA